MAAQHDVPPPEAVSWLFDIDIICQPAKRHDDARVME